MDTRRVCPHSAGACWPTHSPSANSHAVYQMHTRGKTSAQAASTPSLKRALTWLRGWAPTCWLLGPIACAWWPWPTQNMPAVAAATTSSCCSFNMLLSELLLPMTPCVLPACVMHHGQCSPALASTPRPHHLQRTEQASTA